jgi:hypothetical protein
MAPMRRLVLLTLLLALVLDASASAAGVRLNEIQAIGTHNSYKREISEAEQAVYEAAIQAPGDYDRSLAYSHAALRNQFALQGVRGLELDLFGDPGGGLYADPLIRRPLGIGPLADPAWRQPGIKVLHIADLDYETTCVRFVTCLEQVRGWSAANPRHVPLLILLELKQSDPRAVAIGGAAAPPWDTAALDALDAEIRSVFAAGDLITPDDVRRRGLTLERSVTRRGWPTLRASRGKVLFLLDNEPGPVRDAYVIGRPSLEGRVLFTNSRPGSADAAFLKRNDARDAKIPALVRAGYLVRTRSDLPLQTVLAGDTTLRDAAFASGAHVVSTDFPEVGMSARYRSDFVARFPDGTAVRCNPVTARPGCRSGRLERER